MANFMAILQPKTGLGCNDSLQLPACIYHGLIDEEWKQRMFTTG